MSSSDLAAGGDVAIQHVLERVRDLEDERRKDREKIDRLEERIKDLEAENERLQNELDERPDVEFHGKPALENLWIGGKPIGMPLSTALDRVDSLSLLVAGDMNAFGDDLAGLYDEHGALVDLADGVATHDDIDYKVGLLRSEHGAQIRALAAETDADLGFETGDKFVQVREHGVDSVLANVRVRDRRAAIVLEHIEDWGEKRPHPKGQAWRLSRKDVTNYLNSKREVTTTIQSKQAGEVFDALESLAEGIPRWVDRKKEDGTEYLYLARSGGDGPL